MLQEDAVMMIQDVPCLELTDQLTPRTCTKHQMTQLGIVSFNKGHQVDHHVYKGEELGIRVLECNATQCVPKK